jgi:tetratricopeptide (TPR) repeat protein
MLEAAENESQLRDAANFMAGLPEPTPYLLTLLGETYLSLNNPAEAATQLDKAIAMSPSFQEPYIDRAKIFMAQRKREEALTLLQKAKAAAPADLRAPMAAADILGAAGDYRGAIALYEEILARNPKADIAANNMAQLIADYQNEDSAMLEKARIAAERFISATNRFC